MSKLNIDQKTIKLLLTDKHSDFLIPDYQRPYAWGEDECATLWDDLFTFAFPNDDCDAFESTSDEYFLGPIVTFKNDAGQLEIIDGQQRLTTIMLLLRAFYDKFANMKDKQSIKVRDSIAGCVWKTDEFDDPDMDALKIDSEVASDSDKDEFLDILRHGSVGPMPHSAYSRNYAFFSKRMAEMASEWPSYIALFAARILNNVILLPIEAESQDTALRIFSTLNDRGLPLADADIFKSQFYKHFSGEGRKDEFVTRWKALEETANLIFKPTSGTPLDELFTRYMYYRRAKKGIRDTTTKSLRDFYSDNSYEILREDATLDDLESLLDFWKRVDELQHLEMRWGLSISIQFHQVNTWDTHSKTARRRDMTPKKSCRDGCIGWHLQRTPYAFLLRRLLKICTLSLSDEYLLNYRLLPDGFTLPSKQGFLIFMEGQAV